MNAKTWQAAAGAAAATIAVGAAFGFLTPGARADKAEKSVKEEAKEFRDELKGHEARITVVEVTVKNAVEGNVRIESKIDKLTDLMLRNARRGAP